MYITHYVRRRRRAQWRETAAAFGWKIVQVTVFGSSIVLMFGAIYVLGIGLGGQ